MYKVLDGLVNAARALSLAQPDTASEENPPPPDDGTDKAEPRVLCASCGRPDASLRCAVCKIVFYCNKKHQVAHWAQHKPFCVPPFQLAVHVSPHNGTEFLTPAFVPQAAASHAGLNDNVNRAILADILQSTPDALHVELAAFSSVCAARNLRSIALVFDHKPEPGYLRGPEYNPVITACSQISDEPGRSVIDHHRVLVFYLEPGCDFLIEPDYRALVATTLMWRALQSPADGADLDMMLRLYDSALSKPYPGEGSREFFDCIVFPALSDKPFIAKLPLRRQISDEPSSNVTFHSLESERFLGDGSREHQHIPWSGAPSWGPFRIYCLTRGGFLFDGSPLNRSIVRSTKGRAVHPWGGNIIGIGLVRGTEMARDVTKEDLDIAINYFEMYGRPRRY